jgi:hypothetical protein
MTVTPNELVFYGSANMPEADSATVGGSVDFTKRIGFMDLSATGTVDVVSSSASDTAVRVLLTGRDGTGVVQTPGYATLTGTTVVSNAFSGQQFQRLGAAVITGGSIAGLTNPGGTAAVGDVAIIQHTRTISAHTAQAGSQSTSGATPPVFHLQAGDGATVSGLVFNGLGAIIRITGGTGSGQLRYIAAKYSATGNYGGTSFAAADYVVVNRDWTTVPDATSTYDIAPGMLFDILPNPVTAITRLFWTSSSDLPTGSTRTYYEKVFAVNNDTGRALTVASVQIASESPVLPSGALLDLGVEATLNAGLSTTNRQTAPAGISFTTQPGAISLANNLPPGAAPNSAGAQGCWARLTLPAGTGPYVGAANLQVQGSST